MNRDFPTPGNFEERFLIELLKRDVHSLLMGDVACEWTRLRGHENVGSFPRDLGSAEVAGRIRRAIEEDGLVRVGTQDGFVDLFHRPNRLTDFNAAWRRSLEVDACLRRLSIEDLIETKLETGRQQDEDDIRFLRGLRERGG